MKKRDKYPAGQDPASQDALKDESNKPEPLYNKTDRNFQREFQGRQEGNAKDKTTHEGSSSGEERDII